MGEAVHMCKKLSTNPENLCLMFFFFNNISVKNQEAKKEVKKNLNIMSH